MQRANCKLLEVRAEAVSDASRARFNQTTEHEFAVEFERICFACLSSYKLRPYSECTVDQQSILSLEVSLAVEEQLDQLGHLLLDSAHVDELEYLAAEAVDFHYLPQVAE